ncbi:TlpA family protein disulfide reductase [Pacificimonas sp. WHA3]|uniref:TlpA family protein disulfide reductase n=1 Tax=Pacificimonas pallii TaxID=2827236 RepID=A0ABS6SB13_9SPHN|nr:TlpA disulfide reductase family protein [Pacificimonas pallii]MBV7255535.1 TlpA family protein disulfide reductase [Pacificimonas pallii]
MTRTTFLILAGLVSMAACDAPIADSAPAGAPQAVTDRPGVPAGEPDYSRAGETAPDATLLRKSGGPAALTSFVGTPTLVNLWATWCAPCVAELPALNRLAAQKGYALNVVAVSQDIGGWEKISGFVARTEMDRLTVLTDEDAALSRAYGAVGLPLTIMYDEGGRELWRVSGPREWDEPGGLPDDTPGAG